MRNKITQMILMLFQLTLLLGGWGAAQAVTPMVAAGGHTSVVFDS